MFMLISASMMPPTAETLPVIGEFINKSYLNADWCRKNNSIINRFTVDVLNDDVACEQHYNDIKSLE